MCVFACWCACARVGVLACVCVCACESKRARARRARVGAGEGGEGEARDAGVKVATVMAREGGVNRGYVRGKGGYVVAARLRVV